MKKSLLFLLSFFLLVSTSYVFAQKEVIKKMQVNGEKFTPKKSPKNIKVIIDENDTKNYDVLGMTNYDLQTNSASCDRMMLYPNGKMSATWIQYQGSTLPSAPERGTGYAHFDGSSWQYTETSGNSTVEGSQRAGWPSMLSNGTSEFVISHYRSSGGLFGRHQTIGSSGDSWSATDLTGGPEAMLWPRTASAGNYYYAIAVDDYNTSSNDIVGLHFYKSDDAGQTWQYKDLLPDFDSYYAHGNGDQYNISARDSIVAVVYFGSYSDIKLWKSTDYGETWNVTTVGDLPTDGYNNFGNFYDYDNNSVADTIVSNDGSGDLVIDSNGLVHIVFSKGGHIDTDASGGSDAGFYFALLSDYVVYWNENYGEGVFDASTGFNNDFIETAYANLDTIGWSYDLNGNDTIWEFGGDIDTRTGTSMSSFSTMGIDADNNIYVAFSTILEGDDYVNPSATHDGTPNSPESYRGVFVLARSASDGVWHEPFLCTDNTGEWTFPMMADSVDNYVRLIMQYDSEPGCFIKNQTDPVTDNSIIYAEISKDYLLSLPPFVIPSSSVRNKSFTDNIKIYPNPATDIIRFSNPEFDGVRIYNILGTEVKSVNGKHISDLDISDLSRGTYIIKLLHNGNLVSVNKIIKK